MFSAPVPRHLVLNLARVAKAAMRMARAKNNHFYCFTTRISTIKACPSSIKDCSATEKSTYVTTETVVDYTTIRPVTVAEATKTASSTSSMYTSSGSSDSSSTEIDSTGLSSGSSISGSSIPGSSSSDSYLISSYSESSQNKGISITIIHSTSIEARTTGPIAIATEVFTIIVAESSSTANAGLDAIGVSSRRTGTKSRIASSTLVTSSSFHPLSSGVKPTSSMTTSSNAPVYTGLASISFTVSAGLLGVVALLAMYLV